MDLRSGLTAHLRSPGVAHVIYGAIIGLALVVDLEDHPPAAGVMIGTLLATALAVGAAELYSEFVSRELRGRRLGLPRGEWRELGIGVLATMAAISFPAAFFVFAAAGALSSSTAFTAAKWSGLALTVAYGYLAGRAAGASAAGAVVHAALVGSIGGLLIVIKALVH